MFVSYETSIELIRKLGEVLPKIRMHDAELAAQIKAAASSVALNLGEGRKRTGKDRLHLFRVANGSAAEVAAGIDVAIAWGYVEEPRQLRALLSRLLGLLWGLTS